MTRHGRRAVFVFLAFFAISAKAATVDFRVLFDVDHDIASGCTVAGMPGVDQVLVTSVTTDDTSAHVTSSMRQSCTGGTLGAATDVDSTGWPAGWQAASGNLLLETRVAFAAFGGALPYDMRIGVQASQAAAAHTALTLPSGQEVVFPPSPHDRRRSVREPGEGRVMMLDGHGGDWQLLTPIFDGIAGTGTPALRILKVFAYADTAADFLYFRFDANLSNDAPFANDDHYTRPAGNGVSVAAPGVLENDGDPNGLPLTATPVSTPAHGTVTLNPDGSFTYTPDASSADADSFEYSASNGTKSSNPATVRITVSTGNAAPVAVADSYTATEDTPLNVAAPGVLQNDSDADGDALTATIVIAATNGTVVLNANGGFTYTPGANFSGTDSFSYSVSDGTSASVATVTITVTGENDAPRVRNASMSVVENSAAGTIVGTAQATDPDDTDTHTFSIIGGNSGNAFAINPVTGVITVATPSAVNFEVTPQFTLTVRATDNGVPSLSGNGTITINVTNANDAPVATSQSVTTPEDAPLPITLGATDEDGDSLSFTVVTGPAHGALSGIAPNLTYTPAVDYNGTDTFTFRASDGTVSSAAATISITISPVNDAPVAVADGGYAVNEGGTLAGTSVLANDTDVEGDALTAVLVAAPAHSAAFTLNANGTFTYTHDGSETVSDSFSYRASDATLTSNVVTVSIAIAPVNDAPLAVADSGYTVAEGGALSGAASVLANDTDAEGNALTAILVSGPAHGTLTLLADGTFSYTHDGSETTSDSFTYKVSDGTLDSNVATVTISITPVNDAPVFTSSPTATVPENTLTAAMVTTSDAENDTVTYSITGGVDAARFAIDAATGALTFIAAPDFEAPSDSDSNNVYIVDVTATDGTSPVVQTLSVTVTDANEAPVITSAATAAVIENNTDVTTVTASDPEGDTVTFSITGGADAALFSIDGATGVLTLNAWPNYEAPADADANNEYLVQVTASDGVNTTAQNLTVSIIDRDEEPSFTGSDTLTVQENVTAVGTLTATDPENGTLTWSITGGPDAARFAIDSATGALTFTAAPDFEAPADTGANNIYEVWVTVTDGSNIVTHVFLITVSDVNDAPVFTSAAAVSVAENTTAVGTVTATDADGDTLTYSITGGADASRFSINASSGALTFNAAPDAEAPSDSNNDNAYEVSVTVSDGTATDVLAMTVTVTNANEAPLFSSSDVVAVAENTTIVTTVAASDPEGTTVTFSMSGGADQSKFSINASTGALTFVAAPDFEAPGDADANNVYVVIVTASDGVNSPGQTITVTVLDANDPPQFTSTATPSVVENSTAVLTVVAADPESDPVAYSITGGADQTSFSITSGGVLTFTSAPDFESPADADGNNSYLVQVTATDGTNTTVQNLTVTVTDANEAPSFTSADTATVAENSVTVMTLTTSDPESNVISYSVTGGADQSAFTVNSSTGVLSFSAAPNFELPGDADANNVYVVQVTANDGANNVTTTITVTVTDYDEAPEFTSASSANVAENTTAVMTISAPDPEGATVTYSITGGADAAKFSLNTAGDLSFVTAPNFESPSDADTNNVYVVDITAVDGTSHSTVQTISVTVTNVNEAPVNALQSATQSVDEDTALVFSAANSNLVSISDPDSGSTDVETTLTITNGNVTLNAAALAALTSVTGNGTGSVVITGTVAEVNAAMAGMSFKGTQDFNGAATIAITTSDLGHSGSGGAQSDGPDSIAITVNPINDAPVAENKTHATHSALGLTINAATNTGELKENATDVDDAFSELTVQLVPGSVSPANATVTLTSAADGSFYFEPPGGFTGAASFQYKVCDDNAGDPNQCSAVKTVTVNVGGTQLWFIDDTDAAGCGAACNGSRTKPLVGLPASNAAYSGDSVFLFSGTYGGHTLVANERLVGQGASNIQNGLNLNLTPYTNGTLDSLPTSGAAPTIGSTITAATGSYLRGVAISSGAAKGYVGSAATSITVSESSVTAANTAVELTGATGTTSVSFTSTSSTAGLFGIYLKDVAGTLSFGSGALSGHTGASFAYVTTAANTPSISYAGDINPAAGGRPVDIGMTDSGMKGGAVTLSGNIGNVTVPNTGIRVRNGSAGTLTLSGATIKLSTAATDAVEITSNPGVTVNFNNATMLQISTTTGRGFSANGGGAINVSGPNNTISTTTGSAFEVFGTAAVRMGGAYTFRGISSNGASKGITLQYHNGSFTLSGDGTDADTLPDAPGAGGTIINASIRGAEFIQVTGPVSLGGLTVTNPATGGAPDATVASGACGSLGSGGSNTGCFAGLHFDTVSNVSLNTVNVSGSGQMGINGNAITNLTMNTVGVSNSGNSAQEEGIRLYNLAGTGSMTSVNVTNSYGIGLNLQSDRGTLASSGSPFLISSSNFQNSTAAQGAVLNAMGTAAMYVKFAGGTISGNFSNGIQTAGNIGHIGTLGIYVDGTSFSNNTSAMVIQASGGTTQFDVRNITHVARATNSSYGIGVKTDGNPSDGYPDGVATGTFANNFIGNASFGSGSACGGGCAGISADARNDSSLTVTIQNNTVRHVDGYGILLQGGEGAGKLNARIVGNAISDPDGSPVAAIYASTAVFSSDTNCLTADIGGSSSADQNSIQGAWSVSGIRLVRKFTPTFNLPGLVGSGTSSTDVNNFIASRNTFSGGTTNVSSNPGTVGGFTAAASCP